MQLVEYPRWLFGEIFISNFYEIFINLIDSRYLRHLFKTGIKRPITEEDVYQTLDDHKYNVVIDRFTLLWDEELKKKNPSVLRLFYNAYGFWTVGIGLCFSILETANRCAQPLLLSTK